MRLDNNRGFFSPEQKSCRIPISLANMFCITEVPCHKNGQGLRPSPGRGRGRTALQGSPVQHFQAAVTKRQAPFPTLVLKAAGSLWTVRCPRRYGMPLLQLHRQTRR